MPRFKYYLTTLDDDDETKTEEEKRLEAKLNQRLMLMDMEHRINMTMMNNVVDQFTERLKKLARSP